MASPKDASQPAQSPVAEYITSPVAHSDILRPTILKYGKRQFRKTTGRATVPPPRHWGEELEEDEGLMGEDEPLCLIDEEREEMKDIRELRTGEFELYLPIPPVFFKYIIGKGGKTKNAIETDTKCAIVIPRPGRTGPVVIIGSTKRSLVSAKQRIEVIVWSNRTKEGITHFLAIPLNCSPVTERLESFKSDVMHQVQGVDEELFQRPVKLHITLPVFYLFSSEEEQVAVETIRDCLLQAREKLGSSPCIKLQGLATMNDDDSAIRVLYAKVQLTDGSPRLQEFADFLQERLVASLPDYVQRREGSIKLHVTLMNTAFKDDAATDEGGARSHRFRKKTTFDGRDIMSQFIEYDFGTVPMTEMCLLKCGERDPATGSYQCTERFPLETV